MNRIDFTPAVLPGGSDYDADVRERGRGPVASPALALDQWLMIVAVGHFWKWHWRHIVSGRSASGSMQAACFRCSPRPCLVALLVETRWFTPIARSKERKIRRLVEANIGIFIWISTVGFWRPMKPFSISWYDHRTRRRPYTVDLTSPSGWRERDSRLMQEQGDRNSSHSKGTSGKMAAVFPC